MEETNSTSDVTTPNIVATIPSAPKLLGWAWKIYSERIITFITISLLVFIPAILLALFQNNENLLVGQILTAVYVLAYIVYYPALILTIAKPDLTASEALRNGNKLILPFLLTTLLSLLAIFGGTILLLIPGIALSGWLMFSGMVAINENLKGLPALQRSWFYVEGKWTTVMVKFIFFGVISFLLSVILLLLTGGDFETPSITSDVVLSLWSELLITPLGLIYSYGIYSSLKDLKAGQVQDEKKHLGTLNVFIAIGAILVAAAIGITVYKDFGFLF